MSHIDKTIARIPSMTEKIRGDLRRRAEAKPKTAPDYADARRVLAALDDCDASRPKASRFDFTGLLAWEKFRHGKKTFRAFHDGEVIGRIFMRANHSGTEKDVNSVEILGHLIPGVWHYIAEARAAGETAFAARQTDAKP